MPDDRCDGPRSDGRSALLTPSNAITLGRILLIPVFMAFTLEKIYLIPLGLRLTIAVAVFIFAAASDGLDGYIARSRNEVTVFGKFFDPLADKLLISAALITLVEMGRLSSWVAVLIISREFAVSGLRQTASSKNIVIAASNLGKAKTWTQIVAISAILIDAAACRFPAVTHLHRLLEYDYRGFNLVDLLISIAVVMTVVSGYDYFARTWKLMSDKQEREAD